MQRGEVWFAATAADGVPTDSVVNFDIIYTIPRDTFRRRVTVLSAGRMVVPQGSI